MLLADKDFASSSFFEKTELKALNYAELLYSKGNTAFEMLKKFAQSPKSYVSLAHSIQFENFPFADENIIMSILKANKRKEEASGEQRYPLN